MSAGRPFVSADIGGTNARVALVRGRADGGIEVLRRQHYRCAAHPSLHAILEDFLAPGDGVDALALAIAGVVNGDAVISRNVPWPIRPAEFRARGFRDVAAVNDFVAVAHADQCMGDAGTVLLTPAAASPAPGATLVVGPGTGFGAAVRVDVDGRVLVLPCEPQQMALAPGNLRELSVLAHWMRAGAAHVGIGHAVSGPGLLHLYRALCALDGVVPGCASAEAIDAHAAAGDATAREALSMFCALLGSVVGDLALATGAGRVFVAGGIPSRIKPHLLASDFAARMVNKDVMRAVLERVPVRLVEDPDLGVIGAAAWFLRRAL